MTPGKTCLAITYLTQNSTVSLQVTGYNASFWLHMLKRLGDDGKKDVPCPKSLVSGISKTALIFVHM